MEAIKIKLPSNTIVAQLKNNTLNTMKEKSMNTIFRNDEILCFTLQTFSVFSK